MLPILILTSFITLTKAQMCQIPGGCVQGYQLSLSPVSSYNSCQSKCQNSMEHDCHWFTFSHTDSICQLFANCSRIHPKACLNCHSGQVQCPDVICGHKGQCQGHTVGRFHSRTQSECQRRCYQSEDCHWYTFYEDLGICSLTKDCQQRMGDADGDVFGMRECWGQRNHRSYSKLLIVSPTSLELKDLVGLSRMRCPLIVKPEVKQPVLKGSFGTFISGFVIVCGGHVDNVTVNNCFALDAETGNWLEEESLLTPRSHSSTVMLSEHQWWITGGQTQGSKVTRSTEVYDITTRKFYPYVDLPVAMSGHCVVKVNDTYFVVVGEQKVVFGFDGTDWTKLTELPIDIQSFQCQLVQYQTNSLGILITGGIRKPESGFEKHFSVSTFFLDLETMTWHRKQTLPYGITNGISISYRNSFIIVGGQGQGQNKDQEIESRQGQGQIKGQYRGQSLDLSEGQGQSTDKGQGQNEDQFHGRRQVQSRIKCQGWGQGCQGQDQGLGSRLIQGRGAQGQVLGRILYYSPENDKWRVLRQMFDVKDSHFVSFFVDDHFAQCG